jgi:hypothetical protein
LNSLKIWPTRSGCCWRKPRKNCSAIQPSKPWGRDIINSRPKHKILILKAAEISLSRLFFSNHPTIPSFPNHSKTAEKGFHNAGLLKEQQRETHFTESSTVLKKYLGKIAISLVRATLLKSLPHAPSGCCMEYYSVKPNLFKVMPGKKQKIIDTSNRRKNI